MGGGLINIVSYGLDDLYLTGAPQVTFFKSVYRRHTNYSQESIEIDVGQTNFSEEIDIIFPKIGDLIGNSYLQLTLPQISLLKTDIVADPSASDLIFLQNDIGVPEEYDQLQNIANNYSTINKFIAINTAGYRKAIANLNIKNQSLMGYINSIQNVLIFNPSSIQTDYRNALTYAFEYENEVLHNNKYNPYLNYVASDISYILTKISNSPDNYTIQDVAMYVSKALETSIKVKNYFFQRKKEMENISVQYKAENGNSRYAKFAWTEKIGHAIIERIDVSIGGDRIDRHYFDYIEIWHSLTGFDAQDILYNKSIGNVIELTSFDRNPTPTYTLNIPLNFWFCKKAGLYFPIVALQYSPIYLTVKFNSINLCAYVEKLPNYDNDGNQLNLTQLSLTDIWDNKGYFLSAKLLTDYVYLDSLERKRFAQSAHEYLIETTQRMLINDIIDYHPSTLLEFSGLVKEIIWYAQKSAYVQGLETQKKLLFNYTTSAQEQHAENPFDSARLTLNGKTLFDSTINNFFTCVMPHARHNRTPSDGINIYSFCLWPEEHQPSGSCNMSVIPNCVMSFDINQNMFSYKLSDITPYVVADSMNDEIRETPINLVILAKKMDILRVIGGIGGFAFKYMS